MVIEFLCFFITIIDFDLTVIIGHMNKVILNLSSKGLKVPLSAVCKRSRIWPSQNKLKMLKLSNLCTNLKVLQLRCVQQESKGLLLGQKLRKFLGSVNRSSFRSIQSRRSSVSKIKWLCYDKRRLGTRRPN